MLRVLVFAFIVGVVAVIAWQSGGSDVARAEVHSGDLHNCGDYPNQAAAQAHYAENPTDPDGLDVESAEWPRRRSHLRSRRGDGNTGRTLLERLAHYTSLTLWPRPAVSWWDRSALAPLIAAVGQVAPQAMLQVLRADILEPRG